MNELYGDPILDLAAAGDGAGRLADATARVTIDNPLCGDRVTMAVRTEGGKVRALAHEVKGCVICQAAAAAIGRHAATSNAAEIRRAASDVARLLKRESLTPVWSELAMFAAVAGHRSRHNCVLLPFRAVEKALAEAGL